MEKIITLFVIVISLISCSNDEDSVSPVKGKWKLVQSLVISTDEPTTLTWVDVPTENQYTFDIKNSGRIESSIHTCDGTSKKVDHEPLFSGDNILMFLKSSSLTKETLLTPYIQGNTFSLADKYAEVAGLKEKWKASSKIAQDVFFPTNSKVFSRLQDSLLNIVFKNI